MKRRTRSLNLTVAGQKLSLKTDADAAYVRSLAKYVTEQMELTKNSARQVPTQQIALLTALNVADELFQARSEQQDFRRRVRAKAQSILKAINRELKA